MKSLLILGHGQLGLMMAAEAAQLGLTVDRIDMQTGELLQGTSARRSVVEVDSLLSHYDVVTAEIEHLPHSEWLERIYASPKWINAQAFSVLPDRLTQKRLLDKLAVPTAPWLSLNTPADLAVAQSQLGESLVIKATTGGYDGKGQWRIGGDDASPIPEQMYGQLIAEQKIPFQRELSVVGARDRNGQCYFFPLTENVHYRGILRYSLATTVVDADLQQQAEQGLARIMAELDFVGVMAMECFVTSAGLLVNELAPRVHNSGHWTQLGASHNQFALQVLAVLGLPFPRQQLCKATIMLNLIGCEFEPGCLALPGIEYHWYGKEVREGRKLGHINIAANNAEELAGYINHLLPLLDSEHQALLQEAHSLWQQRV